MRNYIWELRALGHSYKSIASQLGVSARTVSQIGSAKARAGSLYEPIRSLHRAAVSKELQALDIHGRFVAINRRTISYEKLVSLPREISDMAGKLVKDWNRPYNNYIKDPAKYLKKMGTTTPPKHFTQEEVERRIKKSLSHKQEVEDAINDEGHFTSP